jgi:hypothetical protein
MIYYIGSQKKQKRKGETEMKIFKLDEQYEVVCNWEKTRNGFRHLAVLRSYGREVAKAKACYLNRTWECYEYESVLLDIIHQNFKGEELAKYIEAVKYENIRRY